MVWMLGDNECNVGDSGDDARDGKYVRHEEEMVVGVMHSDGGRKYGGQGGIVCRVLWW